MQKMIIPSQYRKKTTMMTCPNCEADAYLLHLIVAIGAGKQRLGETLFKCRNLCTPTLALSVRPLQSPNRLPDQIFVEMIDYARSIGKIITSTDLNRERQILIGKKIAASTSPV